MESEASWFVQSALQFPLCLIFFSFTISFTLFSLLLFLFRISKLCCNCDLCNTYLTSTWSLDFHNLCDWYTHLLRKSPSRTITLHAANNIITANPENVEYILKTKFHNFPKGKPFSAILGDLLGRGIFNVDGDSWNFQRKMASLELGSLSVRFFAFDIVSNEINTRLVPLFQSVANKPQQTSLDLQDVFRRFSFDNICRFSFGLDPGCLELSLPASDFAEAFDLASRLSAERALSLTPLIWKIKRAFNLGTERKLREAINMVNELANEVIRQKRRTGFATHQDLLSRFMGLVEDDDTYLRDIVISFLLAGRDTVASTLTSFFFLVAKHPEVESAILAESDRVIGPSQDHNYLPSFQQMREMNYLHAAVYESMRLYPPVQFDSKFAQEDDVLPDGTFVKKGTRVTYHPYAMGRMDEIWGPDCLEFRPDRWLKNGCFSPVSPYKYPVFQAGLRVCLGKELALMETKSVALALIRRFQIVASDPGLVLRFAPGLTATVRGGLPVLVRHRKCRNGAN